MADYISSYSGTEIEAKLNQVKTEGELTTFVNNLIDTKITAFANNLVNTNEIQVCTINSKGLSIVVRKWLRMCTITVNNQLNVATASWEPFNPGDKLLPVGFRPAQEVYHAATNTLYVVNPNGAVYMSAPGSSGYWVQFSISYICG